MERKKEREEAKKKERKKVIKNSRQFKAEWFSRFTEAFTVST